MSKQNKTKQEVHKNTTICGLVAGPEVWLIDPVTLHWRTLIFPLPASSLGWDLVSATSSQCWDPAWLEPVKILYMPPVSVNLYVRESSRVWKTLFAWSCHRSDAYSLPASSFIHRARE